MTTLPCSLASSRSRFRVAALAGLITACGFGFAAEPAAAAAKFALDGEWMASEAYAAGVQVAGYKTMVLKIQDGHVGHALGTLRFGPQQACTVDLEVTRGLGQSAVGPHPVTKKNSVHSTLHAYVTKSSGGSCDAYVDNFATIDQYEREQNAIYLTLYPKTGNPTISNKRLIPNK